MIYYRYSLFGKKEQSNSSISYNEVCIRGYICIGVYMNTPFKAVKSRKRDSLKPFLSKKTDKKSKK